MRFFKRLFFVILLLLVAFFVYRLISPAGAKSLLYDIKSFSNSKIGTHFSLSGDVVVSTGILMETTGDVQTGAEMLETMTGDFFEATGDDLLLSDVSLEDTVSTGVAPVVEKNIPIASTGTVVSSSSSTPAKTTSSSAPKTSSPSSQERRTMESILDYFK